MYQNRFPLTFGWCGAPLRISVPCPWAVPASTLLRKWWHVRRWGYPQSIRLYSLFPETSFFVRFCLFIRQSYALRGTLAWLAVLPEQLVLRALPQEPPIHLPLSPNKSVPAPEPPTLNSAPSHKFLSRELSGGWEEAERMYGAVREKSIDFRKILYRLFRKTL